MKRICMHVLMVLALFFPFSGFAQEKNMVDNEMKFQEIDNDLEAMIGQMLMFGMRGQSLAEDVEIRKMLEQAALFYFIRMTISCPTIWQIKLKFKPLSVNSIPQANIRC